MSRVRRSRGSTGGGGERGGPEQSAAGKAARTQQLPARAEGASDEDVAAAGTAGAGAPFPYLAAIESSFGRPVTATAHTDAAAQAASRDLGADAYAFGSHVAFAGDEPSLFVAAHEAAHTLQDAATVQAFGGRGAGGGDAHEAHADAVAQRVVEGRSAADLLAPGATAAGTPVVRRHEADEEHRDDPDAPRGGEPDRSARFENDASLASVRGGGSTVTRGQRGLSVTKLQQALIDLGYLLPRFGVDGIFEGETQAALLRFQADVPVPQTGELDQATIDALHARYDTRQPYVAAATHDPANPGTRTLSRDDRRAALDAMLPPRGASATYQPTIPGNPDSYATRIQARLSTIIPDLHSRFYATRAAARANPANVDSWSTIEGPARAAKLATDNVYASNYGGAAAVPPLTHAGGNLLDRWEDETATQAAMNPAQLRTHAIHLVEYLIDAQCTAINREHSAVPSAAAERADLTPVIDSFVDTPAKVQILSEIDIGWPGTQRGGQISLQRLRSQNADPTAAQEENRVRLWRLFHTSIHEYLHLLAHPRYRTWANGLDRSRSHTLMEGFCDFFTLNVRSALALTPAMIADIEGPYANGNPPPALTPGVYASHAQAEQVVSIVGIRNAQAAYFRGQVSAMGGP